MEEGKESNSEIKKIFGEFKKPVNLFDEDEDYYGVLRPQLQYQHIGSFSEDKLPFQGVELLPYPDFIRQEVLTKLERKGHHIFYIRRYRHGFISFCDAAGYYNRFSKIFKIVEYSYIVPNDYFGYSEYDLQSIRQNVLMSKSKVEGIERYLTKRIDCANPSIAASLVLGRQSSFYEWKDSDGRVLSYFYKDLLK